MSHKTPQLRDGFLRDVEGNPVTEVGSEAWFTWLEDEPHHTFHFTDDAGGFTARKEKKQRGDHYWVAYRQLHNKLYKAYLGKSHSLTLNHLSETSIQLAQHIDEVEQAASNHLPNNQESS
jgi:hypothetical protein